MINNKKIDFMLVCSITTTIFLFGFFLYQKSHRETQDITEELDSSAVSRNNTDIPLIKKIRDTLFDDAAIKKPEKKLEGNIFSNYLRAKELGGIVNEVGHFLDSEKGLEFFRRSKIDNIENYKSSLEILEATYLNLEEESIYLRVLALKLVDYSSHTQVDDVEKVIISSIKHFEDANTEQIKKNILLDIYELVQILAKLNSHSASDLLARVSSEDVKNAIKMGIRYVQG